MASRELTLGLADGCRVPVLLYDGTEWHHAPSEKQTVPLLGPAKKRAGGKCAGRAGLAKRGASALQSTENALPAAGILSVTAASVPHLQFPPNFLQPLTID